MNNWTTFFAATHKYWNICLKNHTRNFETSHNFQFLESHTSTLARLRLDFSAPNFALIGATCGHCGRKTSESPPMRNLNTSVWAVHILPVIMLLFVTILICNLFRRHSYVPFSHSTLIYYAVRWRHPVNSPHKLASCSVCLTLSLLCPPDIFGGGNK